MLRCGGRLPTDLTCVGAGIGLILAGYLGLLLLEADDASLKRLRLVACIGWVTLAFELTENLLVKLLEPIQTDFQRLEARDEQPQDILICEGRWRRYIGGPLLALPCSVGARRRARETHWRTGTEPGLVGSQSK